MTAPFGYPPAQQPQYPAQPPYQPQYPGQQPQGYPPQSTPQPQQPFIQQQFAPAPQFPQAGPPLAQGSLDDFFNQPSGGGKALSFKQPGASFVGIVSRPITTGDVQQQTNTQGIPQTFKDGRPKFVMKVPLQMQPSPEYPDGVAVWYVKGSARDELVRAMSEAGAPGGAPEHNAVIQVTYTGDRQIPGLNAAKQFAVQYQRPDGAAPAAQAPAAAQPQVQQPQVQQPPAQQQPAPGANNMQFQQPAPEPQYAQQPQAQQPMQQFQPQAPAVPQQAAQQPAPQQMQMPAGLSPDKQELLARLTGAGQPTA